MNICLFNTKFLTLANVFARSVYIYSNFDRVSIKVLLSLHFRNLDCTQRFKKVTFTFDFRSFVVNDTDEE